VNKKDIILAEAKRLSGRYGYLGFTLKQLAQACDMTAPALYYFYTSKADLFKDCLLSELEVRHAGINGWVGQASSLTEFAGLLANEAFERCGSSQFRTGQAMQEIVHLPEEIQVELRDAWERLLINPVEAVLDRFIPGIPELTRNMLATFFINMATFAGAYEERYGREAIKAMMVAAASGFSTLREVDAESAALAR
jgi:AcrR family transcriptional regulator